MVLPTRGQRDWDDELNAEFQRLDGDVQSAKADATTAKSTAISAQNSASAAANSAAQSATAAQVAADGANRPTADAMDLVLADKSSSPSQRLANTFVGAGVNLATYGLDASTPDISTVIAAAVADGKKHLVVPYRAAAWPSLTEITLIDTWLEFEPGARISFNHNDAGLSMLRSRLSRAHFTSTFTGPASAADATSLDYTFPAREVTLADGNVIDGSYYQEYACNGIHFTGAHNRINCGVTLKNIRHQRGWAAAIHSSGAACFDNRISGPVYIDGSDRGIENEDGASDIQYLGGGYLKNVYPNGYTGQGSAASYETYTFVLDAHAHEGTGGIEGIVYGGTWTLENCGTGVTFLRSTGTNDADLPRNCRVDELVIIGRALPGGAEDITLQGKNHHIGRVIFDEGAGVAGGTFRVKGFAGSTNNRVGDIIHRTEAARPTISDDGTGLQVAGHPLPLSAGSRAWKFLSLPNRPLSTNNGLGNGTLRTVPVYLPHRVTIDQLGAEITAAGDAGSVLRLGVYSNSKGLPGSPLAQVTVPADAVGTPMTLFAAVTLDPGWYHVGGVVQGVTTTQPTVRCCVNQFPDDRFLIFTPSVNSVNPMGYSKGGVTGVLGAWGTSISTTNLVPRVWARVTDAPI